MHDPKDMQPGNSSAGLSSGGGPTFKPQNPVPDMGKSICMDNSESDRTTSHECDAGDFGHDYDPIAIRVKEVASPAIPSTSHEDYNEAYD